jgi:hypothetical protein
MDHNIYAIRTSRPDHVRYKAHLGSGSRLPVEDGYQLDTPHVSLTFAIPKFGKFSSPLDQKSERFLMAIEPVAFTDMAHAMMKADPQEAIRAFGKAMQDFEITMPDEKSRLSWRPRPTRFSSPPARRASRFDRLPD